MFHNLNLKLKNLLPEISYGSPNSKTKCDPKVEVKL